MDLEQLDRHLRAFNEIEQIQQKTGENINDIALVITHDESSDQLRMPDSLFFDTGPIQMRKHHRFAPMPVHRHTFIELNYIYSGTCTQQINGEKVVLQQGQICMLDSDVLHGIERMDENDILINILIRKDVFASAILGRFATGGIVSQFLLGAMAEDTSHDRYVVFESENHEKLQFFVKNMMCEAFGEDMYAQEMLYGHMMIIFTELMRVYSYRTNDKTAQKGGRADLIDVLAYIERHYRTCTLTRLADAFNFNPNYLGNLLKKKTGRTFMELIKAQRMLQAAALLSNTDDSIEQVAHNVGYDSPGFFYRSFTAQYGMTPKQYRRQLPRFEKGG